MTPDEIEAAADAVFKLSEDPVNRRWRMVSDILDRAAYDLYQLAAFERMAEEDAEAELAWDQYFNEIIGADA